MYYEKGRNLSTQDYRVLLGYISAETVGMKVLTGVQRLQN